MDAGPYCTDLKLMQIPILRRGNTFIAVLVKSFRTTEEILESRKHYGCIVVAIQNSSVNQKEKL